MKKLIVTNWTTLDGFIAGPNGEMDWVLGDDELSAYEIGMVSDADTLLLGKKTYQDFAGYWPRVPTNPNAPQWEKDYASKINALHKVVISRQLPEATWSDSEILREISAAGINKLKNGTGKNVLMYGSASIVRQLTNLGLIDEHHVLFHPVLLGGGRALFENIGRRIKLERTRVQQFKSGVQLLVYRPS